MSTNLRAAVHNARTKSNRKYENSSRKSKVKVICLQDVITFGFTVTYSY